MALKILCAEVDETESSLPTTVLQQLSELVMLWAEGTLYFFSSWCTGLSPLQAEEYGCFGNAVLSKGVWMSLG